MLKVLIVDDEAIFRLGIRSSVAWEKLDCVVCGETGNGEEAVRMIGEKHPDIVFLDIKMPVLDGIGVLRQMSGRCRDSFFVILSCFNEYEYVREAMKLGAYDYLFKPVMGAKELTDMVKEIREQAITKKRAETEKENADLSRKLEILKRGALCELTAEDKRSFALLDPVLCGQPFLVLGIQMTRDGALSYDFETMYEQIFGQIQEALAQKNPGGVYELLRSLKKDILMHKYYSIQDYCHFLAANMIAFMRRYQGGRILEELLLEDYNLISNLYHQISIDRANEEFLRILQICFREVHGISVPRIQETLVETALQYMQENYRNKISLDEIAAHLHINKNYFCKIFKQETGNNLVNYLTELRLEKATQLLENTDKKVYEIAEEVGFSSYPYFCRTYKKYRNISPTEVKRNFYQKSDREEE